MITRRSRSGLIGLTVGLVTIVAAIAGRQASSPERSGPAPRPRGPDARSSLERLASPERLAALERAVIEADANGSAAVDLEPALAGSRRVLLATSALEEVAAEDWSPLLSGREHAALVAAARFLKDLARSLEGRAALARATLDAARLTPEDARFLLAAVRERLDRLRVQTSAPGLEPRWSHASAAGALDPRKLVEFRDMPLARGLEAWAP